MKRVMEGWMKGILAAAIVAGVAAAARRGAAQSASGALFPNDLGPNTIDVSSYPKEYQETYKVFQFKCAACHTIARPINSQYVELSDAEQAAMKKSAPEIFKDPAVWQIGAHIWNRYVKKMMAKPGCPVGRDGKRIWQFLVYDSKVRKTGAKAPAWESSRKKLLEEFAKANPARYHELFPSTVAAK